IKITRHPICAGKVNRILTAVGEIKNSAVLKKASDNAAYAYAVADAANTGPKRGHATYDQVDLDSGLRRAIKRSDNIFVEQGIHLRDDARRASESCMVCFTRDQVETVLRQIH